MQCTETYTIMRLFPLPFFFSGEDLCWGMFTDLRDDNGAAHNEHLLEVVMGTEHGSCISSQRTPRAQGELICIFILMKGTDQAGPDRKLTVLRVF